MRSRRRKSQGRMSTTHRVRHPKVQINLSNNGFILLLNYENYNNAFDNALCYTISSMQSWIASTVASTVAAMSS